MGTLRAVLLDITGVLKDGEAAIVGSIGAVERLRASGIQLRFVTNETQVTKAGLVSKLQKLGFNLSENEVFAPGPAMVKVIDEKKLRPFLLVHPNALDEFKGIDQSNPNCVVVGDAAEHFTYDNMNKAFQILLNMETPCLYTLGKGKYYREEDGLVLDVGAYTAALEYATGAKAILMGKPHPDFFQAALNDLGVEAQNSVMVGDDVVSDIGGAQECGMRGVLVRTGKFRVSDESHPQVKPYHIADNLAQAVEHLLAKPL